jgi:hypothetical protein
VSELYLTFWSFTFNDVALPRVYPRQEEGSDEAVILWLLFKRAIDISICSDRLAPDEHIPWTGVAFSPPAGLQEGRKG